MKNFIKDIMIDILNKRYGWLWAWTVFIDIVAFGVILSYILITM